MKNEDGFYWLPRLSKDLADIIADLRDAGTPESAWPDDIRSDYRRQRQAFTAARAEFLSWVRKDRDSRMTTTAKAIMAFVVDCLNFDTGRCDPSHQLIADEIGLSLRQVERLMPRIALAGWYEVIRRGKTTSNFYRIRVPAEKISRLLDYSDDLRERRKEERQERRTRMSDPTPMSDHSDSDPTSARSHDPTPMADHEPTSMTGKPMKRTLESEPGNKKEGQEAEGYALSDQDDTELPYEAPASLEDSKRFLVKKGVPPHRMGVAMHKHVHEKLYASDIASWIEEARHGQTA